MHDLEKRRSGITKTEGQRAHTMATRARPDAPPAHARCLIAHMQPPADSTGSRRWISSPNSGGSLLFPKPPPGRQIAVTQQATGQSVQGMLSDICVSEYFSPTVYLGSSNAGSGIDVVKMI